MSQGAYIELAHLADAEWMAELSRTRIEAGLGWRWTASAIRRLMGVSNTESIVARWDGRPAGFALMQFEERPAERAAGLGQERAHLVLFAVEAGFERRGIGGQMLAWLEIEARVAGLTHIQLEVRANNAIARHFYRGQGYRDAAYMLNYYEGREDAVRMESLLGSTQAEPI